MATILLVDDDLMLLKFCCHVLADMRGFRVMQAGSGGQAIEIANRHDATIDLQISDISMPGGISGIDVARHLAHSRPETKVLLISGRNAWDFVLNPSWEFLAKPFPLADLVARVETMLRMSNGVPTIREACRAVERGRAVRTEESV